MDRHTARQLIAWFELGIGLAVLVLVAAVVTPLTPSVFEIQWHPVLLFGVPVIWLWIIGSVVPAVVGLAWMVRVVRGVDADEPGPWRFRDD